MIAKASTPARYGQGVQRRLRPSGRVSRYRRAKTKNIAIVYLHKKPSPTEIPTTSHSHRACDVAAR